MSIFQKKETLTQNITFMALMSAINVLVSLICRFTSIASIFIVLFLPFCSVLVAIFCKNKYIPIYFFATILLSLTVSIGAFEDTLFYVIPAILSGLCIGLLLKYNFNACYIILIASLLQLGIMYLDIVLYKLIFENDLIGFILNVFSIDSTNQTALNLVPLIIFIFAEIQTVLSFIIISSELKRISFERNSKINYFVISICSILAVLLSILLSFFSVKIEYLFIAISIYFAIAILYQFLLEKRYNLIIVFSSFILVEIIVFAGVNQLLDLNFLMLILNIVPFFTSILTLIYFACKKQIK